MTLHYLNFKLLLLLFFALSITSAQNKRITIISNIENAHVTIDSIYIGTTPIESYMTDKDTIKIFMSDNNFDVWENERKAFDVAITKDTVIEVIFRKRINITTEPVEAELYLDSTFIGLSPLQVYLYPDGDNNLEIKKTYYKNKIVNLNENGINSLHFDLEIIDKEIFYFKGSEEKLTSKELTYFIVSGLAAGLVSGFTKMRADAIEKEYSKSLDVSLKSSIKTYDTVSNISLAIFGGCFFYVNYLLLRN